MGTVVTPVRLQTKGPKRMAKAAHKSETTEPQVGQGSRGGSQAYSDPKSLIAGLIGSKK